MQRTPVSSSMIKAIGYDARSQLMEIQFHNDAVYEYRTVSQQAHDALIQATSSIGGYFTANIKGQYPTRKL
jgi:hypothetical protein